MLAALSLDMQTAMILPESDLEEGGNIWVDQGSGANDLHGNQVVCVIFSNNCDNKTLELFSYSVNILEKSGS